MHTRWLRPLLLVLVAVVPSAPVHSESNPLRDVFFGETHVHTSWSLDAWAFGNQVAGPDEAYRYAMGEPVLPTELTGGA
jgi:hypothetical protein